MLVLLCIASVHAQTSKISGKVTEAATGEPITGASVFIQGTTVGTTTNIEGEFTLDVPANAKTLTVSYIGMATATVEIGRQRTFNVQLKESVSELDEVMVVAYGTTTRASFTGSAAKINASTIENRPITNVAQALSGTTAGVQVGNNTGQPGTGPDIRIRGISSINSANDPLWVVDGSPYENAVSSINPDDIESLTILKDAASSALYGARAAAGVIIITTKSGKKGQPRLNLKYSQSFEKVGMEFYDLVNAQDYYELTWEKVRNTYYYPAIDNPNNATIQKTAVPYDIANQLASGIISQYVTPDGKTNIYKSVYEELKYNPFNVANNAIVGVDGKLNPNASFMWADDMDWMNGVRQLGLRSETNVSYSGSNDKTDYYASLGYLNERGYMKGSSFDRVSARINLNTQITSWLKTGLNLQTNISEGMTPAGTDPYYYPLYMAPIYPIHIHDFETGEYVLDFAGNKQYDFGGDRAFNSNHNVIAEIPEYQNTYTRNLVAAKPYVTINFFDGLSLNVNYSLDLNTYYSVDYTPKLEGTATSGELSKNTSKTKTWNFNQLLKYVKTFKKHNVDLLAGHEAFSTNYFYMDGRKRDEIAHGIIEFGNYSTLNDLSSYTTDYRTEGYILRANYDYDGKYMASFSYRRDASSKFHKDTRWDGFWSAGLGWRIDKEKFVNLPFLDLLKLRASYGEVGNDSGIGRYAWQSLYSLNPNAGAAGFAATSLGNRDLKWETNINYDVAIEFGLFDRISGSVEYFNKESNDMLYSMPLNPSSGFSTYPINAFSMYNRGFEVELGAWVLKNRKALSWEIRGNISHYKNKVTDMPVAPYRNDSKQIEIGHSVYEFNLRHFMGVNPDDGLSMYTPSPDLTEEAYNALPSLPVEGGDSIKYTNNVSQAGYFWTGAVAIPKVYGGISTTLSWKDMLSLTIRTSYQFGGKTFDSRYRLLMTPATFGRAYHKDILNRWQNPGDITDVPRMDGTSSVLDNQEGGYSDRWLVSNDYFELSSVNINYNLPKSVCKLLNFEKVSVYATGEMLYRYTARKGLNVRYNFQGTTGDGYLPATVYTLGLNVSF